MKQFSIYYSDSSGLETNVNHRLVKASLKVRQRSLALSLAILIIGALLSSFSVGSLSSSADDKSSAHARLVMIVIVDGLRPDSINQDDTPNLYRLRAEGANYLEAHSVFPTSTRINAAAMATGYYPTANGLVSNWMFVLGVNGGKPFTTANGQHLEKMREVSGGKLLFVRTLAERLQERGLRFAAICSGSTGNALLLNPQASQGVGVLINGYFDSGRVAAYPANVNREVLDRFGAAPSQADPHENVNAAVDWTEQILRNYVLPELKPDVVIDWQSEPDDTQHPKGVTSPEALKALRNCDRNIGLLLKKLESLGLADKTDLIVVSDHGFAQHTKGVNVTLNLIKAGLKKSADSDDLVLVSNSQSVLLYVKNRNPERIKQTVRYLQQQDWTDVIFTGASGPGNRGDRRPRAALAANPQGWVQGTFSLEFIHDANPERGPDIIFTMPWNSSLNPFGVIGGSYTTSSGTGDQVTGDQSGHGGMNPWATRSTMIAWGVDFKQRVTVRVPSSNVDLTPTILALEGVAGADELDGRVLAEALRDGPDPEQTPYETRVVTTTAGKKYRALLQFSTVGQKRYIDKSWRLR